MKALLLAAVIALVIVVLTFLEGIFVAAEIALVTMRRTRVDQLADEGNANAARVKRLIAQPGRFLAVTQIGLTFIGFLASAYAAVNLTSALTAAFVAASAAGAGKVVAFFRISSIGAAS